MTLLPAILTACLQAIHSSNDYVYLYLLVAKEPLEHYGADGINGPRRQDIPTGDTLVAESASFLTGVPAYSRVIYKQNDAWVFGALSKTRVISKKKVKPVYRRSTVETVIYKRMQPK